MDIREGFQIERPALIIPWGTSEAEFQQTFSELNLRCVTHGYFTADCTVLEGLPIKLGFHFYPRGRGRLTELEFFRSSYRDLAASYREFQEHLEITFGPPTMTTGDSGSFPAHTWRLPGADVVHLVLDRFGPEEHVRIKRTTGAT